MLEQNRRKRSTHFIQSLQSIFSMARTLFFALVLCLSFVTINANCFKWCRFYFNTNKVYLVGKKNDAAFTGPIKLKGEDIGHIDETGEAHLVFPHINYFGIPISKYKRIGLKQSFSPSFFKSYNVYTTAGGPALSGVGHETPQQNQANFLKWKCWALPIRAYQVLDKNGNVVANKHPRGNPLRDCVSFWTV